jgi:tape measure domain-containing protein
MAETNEFFIKIGADVDDAMKKLNMLSNRLSTLASNTQRSGNQISGSMMDTSKVISAAFSEMGMALTTAGIVAGIIGIGKAALTTAAQLEQISVSFEVFTGSAKTAEEMLAKLKAQALASPMQFQDITKGAQTLLQYGLTAEQVTPITRMLGDISGGNADKFQRLSLAFGQVNAAGRLMGQEARQMINAGFNPLKAISDSTGQSMASLTQKMHDGQISVQDVADAFTYATSEGGQFFGMADKQSQTLQGAFNKLSESITFALADIGDGMARAFNLNELAVTVVQVMNDVKTAFQNNRDVVEALGYMVDRIRIVFQLLGNTIIFLINAFQGLASIFNFVMKAGQPVRDFFSNLIVKAYEYLKSVKYIGDALEWLIGKFTKIDNAKPLKAPEIDMSKATGFSTTPSRMAKEPKKAEKVEVIPGTDFQTKEYGNHLKKLKQISEDAVNQINNIGLTGNKKKLADLYDAFQKEKGEYMKYGMDVSDITRLYLVKAAQLQGEIESERMAALMKIIKPLPGMEGGMLGKALTKEQLQKFSAGTQIALDNAQVFSEKMKNRFLEMGQTIRASVEEFTQSIASSFANMFIAIGEGSSAEDAIKNFGISILGVLGDMFIKIGMGILMASEIMATVQAFLMDMFTPFGVAAGLAGGLALMALGGLMKGTANQMSKSGIPQQSSSPSVAQKASGSNYAMGGSSYSAQSVRLSIDLTGSITSTQTGYQINKSLETVLRVTGR